MIKNGKLASEFSERSGSKLRQQTLFKLPVHKVLDNNGLIRTIDPESHELVLKKGENLNNIYQYPLIVE